MGIGDFVSSLFGSKNEEKVNAPHDVYNVNPNSYQYGGAPGGAQAAQDRLNGMGEGAAAHSGEYSQQQRDLTAQGSTQMGYGNTALGQGQQGRQGQMTAADMLLSRAQGHNLISQQVAQQQQQQLSAQQASAAASARGPAALAMAQQNAANNTSTGQSQIAANAAIAGAQEQLANTQAAGQAYGQARAQDIGTAQTSYGAAGTSYGAGAQAGQLAQGQDQLRQGYAQLGNNVAQSQLQAQMNQQAQQSSNVAAAQGLNAQVGGQNANMNQQGAFGLLGLGSSVGSAIFGSGKPDAKAAGGPVQGGTPYLVGEQGPELVVPQQNATVIPAQQTAQLTGSYAPSTWGGAAPDYQGQAAAMRAHAARQQAEAARAPVNTAAGGFAVAGPVAPLQRMDDERLGLLRARERQGIPMSDAEQTEADVIAHRMGSDKQSATAADGAKAKEKVAAEPKKTLKQAMSGVAGDFGKQLSGTAGGIDTGFHGGSGYVPPSMVGLPQLPVLQTNTWSDERTKDVLPLYEAPGQQLHQTGDGHAFYASEAPASDGGGVPRASFSGPSSVSRSSSSAKASAPEPQRTPKRDLGREADEMLARIRAQTAAIDSQQPAVRPYSDERTKIGVEMPSPADGSGMVLAKGGGLDVMGSLAATNKETVGNAWHHPGSNPTGGMMMLSDARAKQDAFQAGVQAGAARVPPAWDPDSAPRPSAPMSSAELAQLESHTPPSTGWTPAQWAAISSRPKGHSAPKVDLAGAARSMAGTPYAYKPGFGQGQASGEVNVGPMAQNMAAHPVAATAVKQDPSGLLMLDQAKLSKLGAAIDADHQRQLDEHEAALATLASRRGGGGKAAP